MFVHPCVASTMTSAVTSRACLHRFADKQHVPGHSEVHNGPVIKISYINVRLNSNNFLVSGYPVRWCEKFHINMCKKSDWGMSGKNMLRK